MLENAGMILIVLLAAWLEFPLVRGNSTPADLLETVLAAVVCTACFYFLSVVLATLLDDTWQLFGGMFVLGLAWWALTKLSLPPSVDIFRFTGDASPLITHTLPWPAMAISVTVSAILFFAALKIVRTREY
jgi:hypothetical protein